MTPELTALRLRLMDSVDALDALNAATDDNGMYLNRLAKRSGLEVALRHLDEIGNTPLDEVEVSPARHSDPATSKAAALTLSPQSAYGKLARCFYDRHEYEWRFPRMSSGQHGLTAEQAVALTGIGGKSPWKRCSEIRAAGIIEPTGGTIAGSSGRQQQLLAITDFGKAEVERLGLDAS